MKKIMFFVAAFFLVLPNTLAESFFWSDQKLDGYKVLEEQKRYRFYKEEKEGEYLKKGIDNTIYQYEDESDITYGPIGEYQDKCEVSDDKEIEYKKVYPYQIIPKAKYLRLNNIAKNLYIKKIDIFEGSEKLSYNIEECINCDGMTVKSSGRLLISFDEPVTIGNIRIVIDLENTDSFVYDSYFYSEGMDFLITYRLNTSKKEFIIDSYKYQTDNLGPVYYSDEKIERDNLHYPLEEKEMCAEKEIMTYHYNLKKVYYDDDYHTYLEDESYVKDENDFRIFYKYAGSSEKLPEENKETDSIPLFEKQEPENNAKKDYDNLVVDTGYHGKNKDYLQILYKIFPIIISLIILKIYLKIQKKSN